MKKSSASIISLQNPQVKHWVKLRENRKYRIEQQAVLIEGSHLLRDLSKPIKTLIICEGKKAPKLQAKQHFVVSRSVFEKISGVQTPEGIAAEIALPPQQDLSNKKLLLAADHLSDPGNLGTLIRTALAFGFEGLFLTETSVDPFNDKALRAAKGATFKLPMQQGSTLDLQTLIQQGNFQLYLADLNGTPIDQAKIDSPAILMLGNEAQGLSNEMRKMGIPITIPIKDQMESLNVAVAGGILMHHIVAGHGKNR